MDQQASGESFMVSKRAAKFVALGVVVAGTLLIAQSKKEYHFIVGPSAGVSIINPYGSISVKPSLNSTVVVSAILHSDKVEIDNSQSGNRVDIRSHLLAGADAESGRVDYEVLVPADASITLHSSTGSLHAEKLHGDVSLEGPGAAVDVRDIANAHVHVMHEAYSHELIAAGFWPGNEDAPQAEFYSYAMPAPPGLADATIRPESAKWVAARGEFILPYDAVRTAADPAATLLSFMQSTYDAAADLGRWDRALLEERPICDCVRVPATAVGHR